MPDAYFITGTGRCASRLVAELLSMSGNSRCRHEFSFSYVNVVASYHHGDAVWDDDFRRTLMPAIAEDNRQGLIYGESSGLAHQAFGRLARELGERARFLLLVRHPATFVPSALARGFFDPQHPHPLEHMRPRPSDPLSERWESMAPAERCLWYWHTVNAHVLDLFDSLPARMSRVVPQESIDLAVVEGLYDFLGLTGFDRAKVEAVLGRRINATPGRGDDSWVNPWSIAARALPPAWEQGFGEAWKMWAEPLLGRLYPTC